MDITLIDCTIENRYQEVIINFMPIDNRPHIECTVKYTEGRDLDGDRVFDDFYIDDLNVIDQSDWPKITAKTEYQLLEIAKDMAE